MKFSAVSLQFSVNPHRLRAQSGRELRLELVSTQERGVVTDN
jgi:hypothetical protein